MSIDKEMQKALEADGEKLRQLTGQDHGPHFIDDTTLRVLDHGFVRLVDSMGSDISIVRAARVSYDAAWRAGKDERSDERLIRYLWKNKHTTPFEAVTMTFEVKAPIFVLRQWHRHRIGWSYNELSARYRELPEEYYVPKPEHIGKQSKDNKQQRIIDGGYDADAIDICDTIAEACAGSFVTYQALLEEGVPREIARTVLPLATYSHMFATVNLKALFHFIGLRDHDHAQFEVREYAKAMKELARGIAPVAVAACDEIQV